jgi:hypothetical protein
MNRHEPNDDPAEERTEELGEVLVQLESEPYRLFEEWLDLELAKLVAKWQHTAAPAAGQSSRARCGKLAR